MGGGGCCSCNFAGFFSHGGNLVYRGGRFVLGGAQELLLQAPVVFTPLRMVNSPACKKY